MSKGFIRYQTKNGTQYAALYQAKRINGKKTNQVTNLGKVINKQQNLYQNRTRGLFTYTIENGYTNPPNTTEPQTKTKLILDFGDAYLLDQTLQLTQLHPILKTLTPNQTDTLTALIAHRILDKCTPNTYAKEWWETSYTNLLYPKANLHSQRLSEFLTTIGEEKNQRNFFKAYLTHLSKTQKTHNILLDSTGLPNDIQFPLTATNNHNGTLSSETRLILVVDRKTKMPIYFRYAAGNIVDVSTLKATFRELAFFGVDISFAIIDAGYYSESNIVELQRAGISFIVRLVSNRVFYKELVAEHAPGLQDAKNLVCYNQRLVYVKKVVVDLFGQVGYAYVALDVARHFEEVKKYARGALEGGEVSVEEMNRVMLSKGLFVLVSSCDVGVGEVLPLYYERQIVEQVFDLSKNNVDLLPLRVHSVEAFRGHLMVSFLASVVYVAANNLLEGSGFCAMSAFHLFHGLKCKVFDKQVFVMEPNRKMNDIAEHLKISIPSVINLW